MLSKYGVSAKASLIAFAPNGYESTFVSFALNFVGIIDQGKETATQLVPTGVSTSVAAVLSNYFVLTTTVFVSVYASSPRSPSSRPMPDILKPPKGAAVSKAS